MQKETLEALEFCVLSKKLEAIKKRSTSAAAFHRLCPGVLDLMDEGCCQIKFDLLEFADDR